MGSTDRLYPFHSPQIFPASLPPLSLSKLELHRASTCLHRAPSPSPPCAGLPSTTQPAQIRCPRPSPDRFSLLPLHRFCPSSPPCLHLRRPTSTGDFTNHPYTVTPSARQFCVYPLQPKRR
ncbi:hypothetical protein SLA2020_415670 [Shorea laevis]